MSETIKNYSDERRAEISKKHSDAGKLYMNSDRSLEHRRKSAQTLIDYRNTLSDEEKFKLYSDAGKKAWSNKSDEEKESTRELLSKYRFDNLNEEDKIERSKILSDKSKLRWENMSKEERKHHIKIFHDARDNWWKNLSKEELDEIANKHSIVSRRYWKSLSEEQLKDVSNRVSDHFKSYHENMSKEERMRYNQKRKEGYERSIGHDSNKNEIDFKNELNKIIMFHNHDLKYECGWYNKIYYPDFHKLFPINPITKGSVYWDHEWDFKVTLNNDKEILIDIDGSIHDINRKRPSKVLKYIQFNDSQRPYQTDGLDSYAVLVYDNNLTMKTVVLSFKDNKKYNLEWLLNMMKRK